MGNDLFLPLGEIEPETKGRCDERCKAYVYVRDDDVYTKQPAETLGDPRLIQALSRDMKTKTPAKNPANEAYPADYLQEWGEDTVHRYDFADVSRLYVVGARYIVFESPDARYTLPDRIPVDFLNIVAALMQYTNYNGELPTCVACQAAVGTLRMPCHAPDLHRICIECNGQMLKRYLTQLKDWKRTGVWLHHASSDELPLVESRHPPAITCPVCQRSAVIGLEDMIPTRNRSVMPRDVNLFINDEMDRTERELRTMLQDDQRECAELRKKRPRPDEPRSNSPTSPPWRRTGSRGNTIITLSDEPEVSSEYRWYRPSGRSDAASVQREDERLHISFESPPRRRAEGRGNTPSTLSDESEVSSEYQWFRPLGRSNPAPMQHEYVRQPNPPSPVTEEPFARSDTASFQHEGDDDDETAEIGRVPYLRTRPSDERLFAVGMAVSGVSRCYTCLERPSFVRYPCGHKVTCLECHNSSVRENNGTMPETQCPVEACGSVVRKAFVDNNTQPWIW
jgi:uncharacterized Zn finger protein (UPF0148 family)